MTPDHLKNDVISGVIEPFNRYIDVLPYTHSIVKLTDKNLNYDDPDSF